MIATTTRWRRGLFQPGIAHLPHPGTPIKTGTRSHIRRQRALCGNWVRAREPAHDETPRCPNCAELDPTGEFVAESGSSWTGPAAGGS